MSRPGFVFIPPVRLAAYAAVLLMGVACGSETGALPVGSSCSSGDQCISAFCLTFICADPLADPDYDGLGNGTEAAMGLDPFNPDTDGDDIPDGTEVGPDSDLPFDADGDGIPDALESALLDADGDCLADQIDPRNDTPDALETEIIAAACSSAGVCGAAANLVRAACIDGRAECDYSAVPGWSRDEWQCDELDNDCDGLTDEGFYYDGIAVGYPCAGIGECGEGIVECGDNGFVTRCSANPGGSGSHAVTEKCDGLDNDCDGNTDNGLTWRESALGQSCTGAGECGEGIVECAADGAVTCSSLPGGTTDASREEYCDGRDNDCDGETDETFSGDPSDLCRPKGLCSLHANAIKVQCRSGQLACDFSDVPGYSGARELLCDGVDDDCDGQVDEEVAFGVWEPALGVRYPGQSCGVGLCAGGEVRCSAGGASGECSTAAFAVVETCNDVDDDCDGRLDNGFFREWAPPSAVVIDSEPGPRVGMTLAFVEHGDQGAGNSIPEGMYACGGARRYSAGVTDRYSGDCWKYDLSAHRFERIPAVQPFDRGALVADVAGDRLLLVANRTASTRMVLRAYPGGNSGWVELPVELPDARLLAAGLETETYTLHILGESQDGLILTSVRLSSIVVESVAVPAILSEGSFVAFSPGEGFVVVQGCPAETFSSLEIVEFTGNLVQQFLDRQDLCLNDGAAAVTEQDTLFVMGGRTGSGIRNGTFRLRRFGNNWFVEKVTEGTASGAVVNPGMVAVNGIPFAFSGVLPEGRGLRRVLKLDVQNKTWEVDSIVAGPSPRAGGSAFVAESAASAFFLGGWAEDLPGQVRVSDMWRFDLAENAFVQTVFPGDAGSAVRAAVAVDEQDSVAYLFGGLDDVPDGTPEAVASFFKVAWETGRWDPLPGGPPARYGHTLVWTGNMLILYGGLNSNGFLGDLWTWTQAGGWIHRGDYGLRFGHHAFWDTESTSMIVVGGRPGGNIARWSPETGEWSVLVAGAQFDSSDGYAWFDAESRSILFVSEVSTDASVVRLVGNGCETSETGNAGISAVGSYAAWDPFGRRGILFGGSSVETGAVSTVFEIGQKCPVHE